MSRTAPRRLEVVDIIISKLDLAPTTLSVAKMTLNPGKERHAKREPCQLSRRRDQSRQAPSRPRLLRRRNGSRAAGFGRAVSRCLCDRRTALLYADALLARGIAALLARQQRKPDAAQSRR